jgi:flagellar hook-basal body complex protein FliE
MDRLQLNLDFPTAAVDPGRAGGAAEAGAAGGAAFSRELGDAIAAVDRFQLEADQQADLVAHGAGNLHEVSMALEKADVAMRLATKVRNKVVDAYNEIMRMSI